MTGNSKITDEQKRRLEEFYRLRMGTEVDFSEILVNIEGIVTEANYFPKEFYQQPNLSDMIIGQRQPTMKVGDGITLVAKVENRSGILENCTEPRSIYLNIPSPPPIKIGDRISARVIAANPIEESELPYFEIPDSQKPRYKVRKLEDHETPVYIVCMDKKEKTLWTYGSIPQGKVTIRTI